jgi:CRP/FNR family transcriptional regulator
VERFYSGKGILSILQKGDLIGEIDGSEETLHSFSAEVIDPVEIGVIQKQDLEILLYRFGDLAIQFIHWMGLTHRATQSKFRDLLFFGKPGALASTLIRLSNTHGEKHEEGIYLRIKLTNTEIADLIGTTREGVNRMLGAWKEDGTINIVSGHIIIRRIADLRKICNCPTFPACPNEICRL